MFRISRNGDDIADADTLEDAKRVVASQQPGQYDVDERQRHSDPWTAWGHLIRHQDGSIEEDRWTVPAAYRAVVVVTTPALQVGRLVLGIVRMARRNRRCGRSSSCSGADVRSTIARRINLH